MRSSGSTAQWCCETERPEERNAITWAMQRGVKLADAAGFFGVSMTVLEGTYYHAHPDYQASAVEAMERK